MQDHNQSPLEQSSQDPQRTVQVRLHRLESIIAKGIITALILYYAGPFVLQMTLLRRPPAKTVRAATLFRLPPDLHIGDWREIKSIDYSYQKKSLADWRVEATVTLRQKNDLFRPDDFGARVRAVRDDAVEMSTAMRHVERLSSKNGLPSIPSEAPLFERVAAAGDESTTKVEFDVRRQSPSWQGPSPVAVWRCWNGILGKGGGWDMRLPVIAASTAHSDPSRLLTREQLPQGALVSGEPVTAAAIGEFLEDQHKFIVAVRAQATAENPARFDRQARSRLTDEVAARFFPSAVYSAKSITLHPPADPSPAETFSCTADVEIITDDDLFVETDFASVSSQLTGDDDQAFQKARQDAAKFLGGFIVPPQDVRLLKPAAPRGTTKTYSATINIKRDGAFWDIVAIDWKGAIEGSRAGYSIAGRQLTDSDLIAGSGLEQSEARLSNYLLKRKQFVLEVNSQLSALEARWGADRAAWLIVQRAINAHGGIAALSKFRGYERKWDIVQTNARNRTELNLTEWYEFPGRYRQEVEASGRRQTIALGGQSNWIRTFDGRVIEPDNQTLAAYRTQSLADHMLLFIGRIDGGRYNLTQKDGETFQGKECDVLQLSTARCKDMILYFEKSAGLLVGCRYTTVQSGRTVHHEGRYDYEQGSLTPRHTVALENDLMFDATLRSHQPISGIEQRLLKNPLVGRPYTPDRRQQTNLYHEISIINNTATHITVYVDDIEAPFVIDRSKGKKLSLQFGSHEFTVVTESTNGITKCRFQIRTEGYLPEPHGIIIEQNGGGITVNESGAFGERRLY